MAEAKREKIPYSKNRDLAVRLIFLLLLVLFLILVYRQVDAKDVPISTIKEELAAKTDLSMMEECDERELKQFIGIEPSAYKEYLYYKGTEALSVDEILVIKVDDKSTLGNLVDQCEKRVVSQKNAFESYGPEQVSRLKNAVYFQKGNFLFYCVAADVGPYEEVFKDVVQ